MEEKTFPRLQYKVVDGELVSYIKYFTQDELDGLKKMRDARLEAEKQALTKKAKKSDKKAPFVPLVNGDEKLEEKKPNE